METMPFSEIPASAEFEDDETFFQTLRHAEIQWAEDRTGERYVPHRYKRG